MIVVVIVVRLGIRRRDLARRSPRAGGRRVVLDGLPHRHVTAAITPNLVRLAEQGGMAPTGGRAVLTSATYPNHATLVTGTHPGKHGITANFVVRDGAIVAAEQVGPATPTLFDLGVTSAAVFGDQNLVGVTGARDADAHWPPDGVVPEDAVRNHRQLHRRRDDVDPAARRTQVRRRPRRRATQRSRHRRTPLRPGHRGGRRCLPPTDRCLTDVVAALRPRWDETFLAVVSDHDQVTVTDPTCIDLWSPLRERGLDLTVIPEGEAAVVHGDDPSNGTWLDAVPGVVGHQPWYDGTRLAWTETGRVFGWGEATLRGIHGGPGSATQVAVVAGGHPLVQGVAAAMAERPPRAEYWARILCRVLRVRLGKRPAQ